MVVADQTQRRQELVAALEVDRVGQVVAGEFRPSRSGLLSPARITRFPKKFHSVDRLRSPSGVAAVPDKNFFEILECLVIMVFLKIIAIDMFSLPSTATFPPGSETDFHPGACHDSTPLVTLLHSPP
jgi:hypothetical protein